MVAAHVVFSPCPFRAAALDFLCACCYWILFISLCCDFPFDLFDRPGTFSHCTPPDTPTLPLFNSFHCNWLLKHKLFLLLFRFHWTNSSVFFVVALLLPPFVFDALLAFSSSSRTDTTKKLENNNKRKNEQRMFLYSACVRVYLLLAFRNLAAGRICFRLMPNWELRSWCKIDADDFS